MRNTLIACVVSVVLTAGCGTSSSPTGEPAPTTPPTQEQTEPPPAAATPEPATPEPAPAAEQWPMPDLVGQVLQDAQDQIQALTGGAVFFTGSHDLSGQDRNQVLDANWKVCTQNIAPGAAVTPESQLDVGVVKLDESCP